MNLFKKSMSYVKESWEELKKVVWPTKKETLNHTLMVIGISTGVALFLGVVDYLLTLGVEKVIQ